MVCHDLPTDSKMSDSTPANLAKLISSAKILMVGAGGIGCELLKNLVLTGFKDIVVVDLDTIDVSNLNRQFLFQKEHVSQPKAVVARESALRFNPDVKIEARHDSIMSQEYNTNYLKQFNMVMNALDNRAARSHVNRMCLAADVPLIESGTAGYLGQVTVIKRGVSECYDCNPKAGQKSYPGCTIRNTPSEPIHCIVWAKHLFNQLFGEADPDEDVSPDTADPEAAGDAGASALETEADGAGNVTRVSTRAWAERNEYDAEKLFGKFFHDDIKYLLSMDKLWTKRRPPTPQVWEDPSEDAAGQGSSSATDDGLIKDQRVWGYTECIRVLKSSVKILYERFKAAQAGSTYLVWDKDDEASLDFVTACANLRARAFAIIQKSRFDVKAMAGNIIPAIATTNAVIAGLIVFEAFKVLEGKFDHCSHVYLNSKPNALNKVIAPSTLDKANPKCYVCSPQPEVVIVLNVSQTKVQFFDEKVLRGALNMISADVMIDDGKGTVIISSEEGETTDNMKKFLSDFRITDGTRLRCEDFHQEYNLNITICHRDKVEGDAEFLVVADPALLQPKEATEEAAAAGSASASDAEPRPSTSSVAAQSSSVVEDMDEDLDVIYHNGVEQRKSSEEVSGRKRSISGGAAPAAAAKRPRVDDDAVAEVIDL